MKATSRAEAKAAGLNRYFPGTACKAGHVAERVTLNARCLECQKEYEANNKERRKAIRKRYTETSLEVRRAYRQQYEAANPEKIAAKRKRYNDSNREAVKARINRYFQANPHVRLAATNRRRAAKLNATPAWADHAAIREIYRQAEQSGLTVDHVIPLQGKLVCGLHVENNLQLLTRKANAEKGNKFEP